MLDSILPSGMLRALAHFEHKGRAAIVYQVRPSPRE